jgi:NAD+ synthase
MSDFDFKVINAEEEIQHIVDEIKKYFVKNGNENTKAVIGISGGKDSTIAAALLVRALGSKRVVGVMMPNGTQSDIRDSQEVCDILDIEAYTININEATEAIYKNIIPVCMNATGMMAIPPIVSTNTPARIRMTTLYAVAALVGGRVINTGNKSELYIGYTTKYGDLAGDFAIFKDYCVREVLEIGDNLDELPAHLVHKAPGDGMSGKTDEDNTGIPYDVLDAYLLDEVIPEYDILRKIEERHDRNIHKRDICMPYIRIKTRAWHENSNKEESPFSF